MKKVYLSILSLAIATLFLGCSDDAAATNYLEGTPATITTVEEASNTLSTVSSLTESGTIGSAFAAASARSVAFSAMSLAPSMAASLASTTLGCSVSGTYTYDDTSVSYSNCDDGYGAVMDGSVKVSGDTLTFSNLIMDYTTVDLTFTMDLSMKYLDGGNDLTMNGTMSMVDSVDSASLAYQSFRVITRWNNDINIDGGISINSTLYPCNNGTFDISTSDDLTPYGDAFSSGTMKVNGVTFDFINSTQVTVTFADGTSETVNQGIDSICTAN